MDSRKFRDLVVLPPGKEPGDLALAGRAPREGEKISALVVSGDTWTSAELTNLAVTRSWLVGADLSAVRFVRVTIESCAFKGSSLVGARWNDVTLKNVVFENCRFDYALLTNVRSAGPVAFLGCSLAEATLTGCTLSTVAFDDCQFSGAVLDGCDLRGADLRGNNLSGLNGASALRGVTLSPAQLPTLADLLVSELAIKVGADPI